MATGKIEKLLNLNGSNTNGNYCKMPDGTMLCWMSEQRSIAGGITSFTWTFPASFSAAPVIFSGFHSDSADQSFARIKAVGDPNNIGTSSATIRLYNDTGSSRIPYLNLLAIGRWK